MARFTFLLLLLCAVSVTPTLHKLKAIKEKLLFGGRGGCNTCGMMHTSNGGYNGGGGGGGGFGGGGGGGFGFGFGGGSGFGGGGGGGGGGVTGTHYGQMFENGGNKGQGQLYDYSGTKGHGQVYDYAGTKGHGGQDGYGGQKPTVVIVKEVQNVPNYGGNHGGDYGGHTSYGGNKGFQPTGGSSPAIHGRPGGYGGSNTGSYSSSSATSFSSASSHSWSQGGQPNAGHAACSTCGGSGGNHMPTGFVAPGTYATSQSSSSASAGAWAK